ncbi:MAG: FAD-dependent thymidylate synthase [Candidatus Cybelea sp.]
MAYSARVLLDSVSPIGVRLTTLEVTFPRFVLAEFNTHRTFCLDGETKLYFDLPTKPGGTQTKRFTITIRELFDKWQHGAAPRVNRFKTARVADVCPSREYTAKELAAVAGYADYTGVDLLSRRVGIRRIISPDAPYRVLGADFIAWLESVGTNRQPMRGRLEAMELRSCNEETGEIYHTHVRDVVYSGKKPVFKVTLKNGQSIVSSKDHQFLTKEGWRRLEDAIGLSLSPGNIATWSRAAEFGVNGIAAYKDPQWLAGLHDASFWRSKKKRAMVRHFVEVESIEYAGERDTYDLEVAGPYHNFVAEGFIVHNSRNSASSRAIPTAKLIERVEQDPVLPLEWGRNKAGMSSSDLLSAQEAEAARRVWLLARDDAIVRARELLDLKVHKQELNRILEPFLWHTVIVTSTQWDNFFELRCSSNAQPEIRKAATLMREAIAASRPRALAYDTWHTPLLQPDEDGLPLETRKRISAARCARVSYLTHEGRREIEKDLELYERLKTDRHLSPFEHVATPANDAGFHANFRGWIQMRAEVEGRSEPQLQARR